jgi:hypothetical protein
LHYDYREGGDGGNGPWFVCVFWCVWRDHKKLGREQNRDHILELISTPGVAIRRIFGYRATYRQEIVSVEISFFPGPLLK